MHIVTARAGGQTILVGRPDGSSLATLCRDLVELFARAREAGAATWLIRPERSASEVMLTLSARGAVAFEPSRARRAWLAARWHCADRLHRLAAGAGSASAAFWFELYRELRRHVGNQRLPFPLRTRLRGRAERWLRHASHDSDAHASSTTGARPVQEGVGVELPAASAERLRAEAARRGISFARPVVALEVRVPPERLRDALSALVADGHTIVRIGDPSMGPLGYSWSHPDGHPAVIDLTQGEAGDAGLDVYVLLHSAFVICGSADLQAVSCLAAAPCLLLGAVDPVASYPPRTDGLFTLKTAVELDTGRLLTAREMLTERYLTRVGDFGHRANTAAEVLGAVEEMRQALAHGWTDSEGQRAFRTDVAASAARRAAERGHAPALVGGGRLARVQADRR